MKQSKSQKGFSLIEVLMVLILIAVLAAIAINAFINFRPEAENAALRADLKVLRTAIAAQYSQMQLRCGAATGVYPPHANLNANDITLLNSPCTTVQVDIPSEARFVQGDIPVPPTGPDNTVLDCNDGTGDCIRGDAAPCNTASGVFENRWCYDSNTGEIWLDSATVAEEAL